MIQTHCKGVDISEFAVGVTCLDEVGDYSRYLFGKGGFEPEETFDTTLPCKACIGVGDEQAHQLHGLLPKTLVQDLSEVKAELKRLRAEVAGMKKGNGSSASGARGSRGREGSNSSGYAAQSSVANSTDPGAGGGKGKSLLSQGLEAAVSKPRTVRDLLRRLAA